MVWILGQRRLVLSVPQDVPEIAFFSRRKGEHQWGHQPLRNLWGRSSVSQGGQQWMYRAGLPGVPGDGGIQKSRSKLSSYQLRHPDVWGGWNKHWKWITSIVNNMDKTYNEGFTWILWQKMVILESHQCILLSKWDETLCAFWSKVTAQQF